MSRSNTFEAAGCLFIKGFSSQSGIRVRERFLMEQGILRRVVIRKVNGQLLDSVIAQYERVSTARRLVGKELTCEGIKITVETARAFRNVLSRTSQEEWARKVQSKIEPNQTAILGSPGEIFAKFYCNGDLQQRVKFCEKHGTVERIESRYRAGALGPSTIVRYKNCNEALEMLHRGFFSFRDGSVTVSPNMRFNTTPRRMQEKRNAHWKSLVARNKWFVITLLNNIKYKLSRMELSFVSNRLAAVNVELHWIFLQITTIVRKIRRYLKAQLRVDKFMNNCRERAFESCAIDTGTADDKQILFSFE